MTSEKQRTSLPQAWQVQLPVFEGPLDLLLHLVRINQVEITDIPVALICDQFYEYLGLMEELNLDVAGDYIYEAALLIQLKSQMLLPSRGGEGSEEELDPRHNLVHRLLEYQRIKNAAQTMAEVDSVRQGIWTRQPQSARELVSVPHQEVELSEVSLFDLLRSLKEVLGRYDHEHPDPLRLSGERFSVRDQFERLLGVLSAGRPYDFLEDLRGRSGRAEVVAAFLALLELARLSLVRMHQTEEGELLLYRTTREVEQHELEAVPA